MLKVAIIEDEKLTAHDLADTLKKIDSEIEVVAILATVKQAIDFLKKDNNLDLLFSDIQLPDGLSFEIYKNVAISVPIIFCTAFEQYALNAFDANGIDYLLKPFNKATVSKALDKYNSLKVKFTQPNDKLNKLMQMLSQQTYRQAASIIVYQGEKIIPVDIPDIALFYLEDEYVFALTFDFKKYIVTQSLEELETLCDKSFFRANRQYLINRKAIKDASRYLNRKILIHLTINYPSQILVGKLKTALFVEWLSNS
jgi:two-component system, LytTR family, response regulator LytT